MPPEIEKLSREELLTVVSKLYYENLDLKKKIFGTKSERFVPNVNPQQVSLEFKEEEEVEEAVVTTTTQSISYERATKKTANKPSRQPLDAKLKRVIITIEPTEDVSGLVKIGEEVTEELTYKAGELYVKKYVRSKYVQATEQGNKILIGQLPERPIAKCIASSELLAYIIVSKFIDHLPIYRQLQIFKRLGVHLSDSTVVGWVNQVAVLLRPLYETHKREVLAANYLQADETPISVLAEDKPGSTHRGYHWVYQDPVKRKILFDYRQGRGFDGPKQILQNFNGYLQSDGYAVYEEFGKRSGITLVQCWAHARRKFVEAEANDRTRSQEALKYIQQLYELERVAKEGNYSSEQLMVVRQEQSLPIIETLRIWMVENRNQVMPKSPIAKAIDYTLSRITPLKEYTNNALLQIDNNLTENAIRPVAIGRKNYLFAGSHEAAQNAAVFYSLFATCKAKGINPIDWLTDVLNRINSHPINQIEELLPK